MKTVIIGISHNFPQQLDTISYSGCRGVKESHLLNCKDLVLKAKDACSNSRGEIHYYKLRVNFIRFCNKVVRQLEI